MIAEQEIGKFCMSKLLLKLLMLIKLKWYSARPVHTQKQSYRQWRGATSTVPNITQFLYLCYKEAWIIHLKPFGKGWQYHSFLHFVMAAPNSLTKNNFKELGCIHTTKYIR